jgi:transposase
VSSSAHSASPIPLKTAKNPKKSWGHWRKLDPQKLQAHVKNHPDATLKELQMAFGVSHHAVWVRLRQLGFTLKNSQNIASATRCSGGSSAANWKSWPATPSFTSTNAAWITACLVNTDAPPASQQNKRVAPLVFQRSCNTEVVDAYFEKGLLPALPPGIVIVLDNARFHQSPTTQKLVEAAGCQLLFLPPYSPALNPIEHLGAAFKTRLRKDLPTATNPFLFIANMSQCYC